MKEGTVSNDTVVLRLTTMIVDGRITTFYNSLQISSERQIEESSNKCGCRLQYV